MISFGIRVYLFIHKGEGENPREISVLFGVVAVRRRLLVATEAIAIPWIAKIYYSSRVRLSSFSSLYRRDEKAHPDSAFEATTQRQKGAKLDNKCLEHAFQLSKKLEWIVDEAGHEYSSRRTLKKEKTLNERFLFHVRETIEPDIQVYAAVHAMQ